MRSACASQFNVPAGVNDCIWRPQQVIIELVPPGRFHDGALGFRCNEAYDLMLIANDTGEPLDDEGEILRPFRAMMHRVASRLNRYEWQGILNTTEEFVVVSLDRIGYWLAEDMKESLPRSKLELLRRRGLLIDLE